ncbi:hypothetical protein IWQ60_010870 [Tieghemiomyces parasiticus]|uniref:RRM domain-containing protein n=1 Tax=Tieghemiomyces parasiticus TaxID=78921 RepID=A0A9W7ZRV6_9FUNG|nr:hypothetical protein IWQ60_010870 [Tieghemiomyces parasiticus]
MAPPIADPLAMSLDDIVTKEHRSRQSQRPRREDNAARSGRRDRDNNSASPYRRQRHTLPAGSGGRRNQRWQHDLYEGDDVGTSRRVVLADHSASPEEGRSNNRRGGRGRNRHAPQPSAPVIDNPFLTAGPMPAPSGDEATAVTQTTMVFVDNLNRSAQEEDVAQEFRQIGPVKKIVMQFDLEGRSTGQAIVEFMTAQDAQQALTTLDGERVHGISSRSIHIRPYVGSVKSQPRLSHVSITGASSVFSRLGAAPLPDMATAPALRSADLSRRSAPGVTTGDLRQDRSGRSGSGARTSERRPAPSKEDLDAEMDSYMQEK